MHYSYKTVAELTLLSVVKLRMLYFYKVGWYKNKFNQEYTLKYYSELRKIIKFVPSKYWVLTRCKECGIYFLTAPSNRGRNDIRCLIGCREQHKKLSSNKRSTAFNKTERGRQIKYRHNQNRYLQNKKTSKTIKKEKDKTDKLKESFIGYIRFIVRLIEGRFVSWQEIKDILLDYFKKWRQHPLEYWLKLCNMTT